MNLPFSRVLVTGATGFIGRHLVASLREKGIEVHTIGLPDGDITDAMFVHDFLQDCKPEAIFHLAAYGTFGNEKDLQRMLDVNIAGTQTLLTEAEKIGCKSFTMAGSAKEYATSRIPISEYQPLAPWDEYAVSKAAAEYLCRLAGLRSAMAVQVLRLSPVYGPGDDLSRFVPVAIASALSGKEFTLSTGSVVRNFTYIDDVVDIFLRAASRREKGFEVLNASSAQVSTFQDMLYVVEKATGKTIKQNILPPKSNIDDSLVLSPIKAKEELGFEAKISIEEGVARTVKWYTETQV